MPPIGKLLVRMTTQREQGEKTALTNGHIQGLKTIIKVKLQEK